MRLNHPQCMACVKTEVPNRIADHMYRVEIDGQRGVLALCDPHHLHMDLILLALGWEDLAVRESDSPDVLTGTADAARPALDGTATEALAVAEVEAPSAQQEALIPGPARQPKTKGPADKKAPMIGRWIDGVEQVICPFPHVKGAPGEPYWVKLGDRNSHAKHHGVEASETKWGATDQITWTHWCTLHEICMRTEGGKGFPFTSEGAYFAHRGKSQHLAPAVAQPEASPEAVPELVGAA
ncbi:hypothetical protein ACFVGM_09305 [Kitasatospora purpeofusca]|uniref:hypothetical protein n=1 Tax=Kitasatospora purpeofusca TaxID=67352 RepID=UPI0036B27B16